MEKMQVVELIIAAILFITLIATTFLKKRRKTLIIILILIELGILLHVGYSYFNAEPQLTLFGENQIILQANEPYIEQGLNANYHNKNISKDIRIEGEVDTSKPGNYVVKYIYKYGNNKVKEIERNIIVEDKESPIIELKGKKEIVLYTDEKYIEPGYIAQDNVDKDLTKQVESEKKKISDEKYEIIYTVQDSSGNKGTETRTINLKKRENKTSESSIKNNNGSLAQTKPSDKGNIPNQNKGTTSSSNNSTESGPNNGVIYLTFDDGPSADITPKILDILKEENVKATFFLLNYSDAKESLVKREVNEGHSIGIHGYSHEYKEIYKSVDIYMENITKLQSKIKKSTGVTTYITRFPGGSSNHVSCYNPGIMTKLTKEVVKRGYKYYDWNVSSGDAGGAKTKDKVYSNVVKGLKRNRNNVVLMHDFSGNTKTLNALRAIIQYGRQNGYTFKPITSNTPMVTHNVYN